MRAFLTKAALAAAVVAGLGGMAQAAVGTDPDWPCIQRKQPNLSLGQIWTGPVPDDAVNALATSPEVKAFAARLEQRRLPMAEAEAEIAEFAKTADNATLTALMVAIVHGIDGRRQALMAGIGRYGHKQVSLAAQIEERRTKMAAMEAASTPDFDAIDAEEKALDWDTRIFTDRQQSLTYVCEMPVILEQRAFALGRAISAQLKP